MDIARLVKWAVGLRRVVVCLLTGNYGNLVFKFRCSFFKLSQELVIKGMA